MAEKSLYEQAMEAAQKRKQQSKERITENLNEVINWLDFTQTMAAATPVGGGGGNQNRGGLAGSNLGGSVRNQMEGRGPSTGSIPQLMTWNWRDPIDNQRFTVTTAKGTKKKFKPFLNDLARTGYDVDVLGSYANRNARGSNRLSEHAYGRAIDINPAQNPMGSRLVTDLPKNIARLAALNDLVWGGTWRSKKDAMHFSTTGW